jgi:acyl carrier protein
VRTYVLSENLECVPIGVVGELYLGGEGLARGYFRRAGLTAERFIPDPFGTEPGARLYRTGDLVRYLADGNIEYLGRIDHQVKIRGFRVELGEIEAALERHCSIRQAVVQPWENSAADRQLAAYIIPMDKQVVSADELRAFLKRTLPDYMVPTAFVPLEALPLSPNGKVDRNALPPPDATRRDLQQPLVQPRNPVEQIIATIWRELLGIPEVGVTENLFKLGAHSLMAARAVSRIRDAFCVDLPLRQLFETPTVSNLSTIVTQRLSNMVRDNGLSPLLDHLEQISAAELEANICQASPPRIFDKQR